ncbi:hypothetical protein BDV26DRAFT_296517 [Aspergillus bertholletiae]|uniref:Zn(2)-C6 fungal-type domain-containing protein n=1 Tax=Aspergillus bertholletiae TaxID=1226010 RepID=A0A5N7AX47_9EURO|nr:hypothetical protein BDV26DRAFT_296517 [Aspergillus bertholletiae]
MFGQYNGQDGVGAVRRNSGLVSRQGKDPAYCFQQWDGALVQSLPRSMRCVVEKTCMMCDSPIRGQYREEAPPTALEIRSIVSRGGTVDPWIKRVKLDNHRAQRISGRMTRQQSGLACQECRRRKARCDRVRPKCGICKAAGRTCVIADKRSPRGPKKGQLKDVRSRLAVLEQQLIRQNHAIDVNKSPDSGPASLKGIKSDSLDGEDATTESDTRELEFVNFASSDDVSPVYGEEHIEWAMAYGSGDEPPWTNLEGLDLSNPQPPLLLLDISPPSHPETTSGELDMSDLMRADLDLLYFERVHPIAPMIHKRQYLAWAGNENVSPARACLRSAIRTIAAAMSAQACLLADTLYSHTKRMLEMQDVRQETGLPWTTATRGPHRQVQNELIQAWLLLAHYEFLRKPEEDALLTSNRAFRLLQVSRAFDLDIHDVMAAPNADSTCYPPVRPSPPPCVTDRDEGWIETEEKRRTLWAAFVLDCLSGMVSDRPTMLHEDMINTRLPMPETDFQSGDRPVPMGFLPETMGNSSQCETMSSFARCIILANLFGRCIDHRRLSHSHSTFLPDSSSEPKMRDFWARHEWLAAATDVARKAKPGAPWPRSGEPAKCDPLALFNMILAHSACVLLSETADARAWQTENDHLLALAYKQVASQAAHEIEDLIRNTPRIAFFKLHPIFPNAIYLAARFLSAARPQLPGAEDSALDQVPPLHVALGHLSDVNNLARGLLAKAQADIQQNTPPLGPEGPGSDWSALTGSLAPGGVSTIDVGSVQA